MNKTKFNSDIYVVCWGKDYPLKPTKDNDGKGIRAKSWNTTDIMAGEYNGNTHLIFTEYSDAQKYFRFPECAIFHMASLIHSQYKDSFNTEPQSRKLEYLTTNLCVIDIDDQALKNDPKNKLYDADFDNSKERYSLSNKILNIIESENGGGGCTEITISNKGYHIIAELTPAVLPLVRGTHLRLTDYICEKYSISDNERERASIDLLLHHQIKRAGQPAKKRIERDPYNIDNLIVPEYMLEDVEEISFKNFSLNNARDTEVHNYSYINSPNYKGSRLKYTNRAILRYLIYKQRRIKNSKEFKTPCFLHGETEASLSIYPEENRYYCHGCHEHGDLCDLVMKVEGMKFLEAKSLLNSLGCLDN